MQVEPLSPSSGRESAGPGPLARGQLSPVPHYSLGDLVTGSLERVREGHLACVPWE